MLKRLNRFEDEPRCAFTIAAEMKRRGEFIPHPLMASEILREGEKLGFQVYDLGPLGLRFLHEEVEESQDPYREYQKYVPNDLDWKTLLERARFGYNLAAAKAAEETLIPAAKEVLQKMGWRVEPGEFLQALEERLGSFKFAEDPDELQNPDPDEWIIPFYGIAQGFPVMGYLVVDFVRQKVGGELI